MSAVLLVRGGFQRIFDVASTLFVKMWQNQSWDKTRWLVRYKTDHDVAFTRVAEQYQGHSTIYPGLLNFGTGLIICPDQHTTISDAVAMVESD